MEEQKNTWEDTTTIYSQYKNKRVQLGDNTNLMFALLKDFRHSVEVIDEVVRGMSATNMTATEQSRKFRRGYYLMQEGMKKIIADMMFESIEHTNGREI